MARLDEVNESWVLQNDFQRQWAEIRQDATAAMEEVGARGWYVLGREVAAFESELGASLGCEVVGCGNGLDGIEIALRVTGISPGDKVLTTPLSAFATTLAILRSGAEPIFTDTDDRGLLDLDQVECLLKSDGSIRVCLPVHLYGECLDLERLDSLGKSGVTIIEDCAQALGASFGGRVAGTVGAASATSFYPTKNLGCLGDGGAVLSRDPKLAQAAKRLRDYGQSGKYEHDQPGLNSRLDELQAAILRRALFPRLAGFQQRRRRVAERYLSGIRHDGLRLPRVQKDSIRVWHLFPVLVPENREGFEAHLRDLGIQVGRHYPTLIPEQAALGSRRLSDASSRFPNAFRVSRCEVSLPIHPFLTTHEIERVIDACNSWR